MIQKMILFAVLVTASATAFAAEGTPQEQAACRSDVRKFCHSLPAGAGGGEILSCLEAHRNKLRAACLAVLVSHGQ